MDETGTDVPWPRFLSRAEEEGRADQEAQGREQSCYGMTQRAGLVLIPSGVNDFKRVKRWVADLYRQRHKAEENQQQTAPAADAGGRP
jgi:hypothetical protein